MLVNASRRMSCSCVWFEFLRGFSVSDCGIWMFFGHYGLSELKNCWPFWPPTPETRSTWNRLKTWNIWLLLKQRNLKNRVLKVEDQICLKMFERIIGGYYPTFSNILPNNCLHIKPLTQTFPQNFPQHATFDSRHH